MSDRPALPSSSPARAPRSAACSAGLKDLSPPTSAGSRSRAPSRRPGVQPEQVDYLIMGQVILAGAGQNPARAAGLAGGLPWNMPSITINKVCLSGLNAIAHGRPADPRRRGRDRGRRRHGVDDQRPAPAAEVA